MNNKKYILTSLIITFILVFSSNINGQDIHFSQYYNTPMLQNVANTGLMSNSDFRVTGIYRNQWQNIPAPFNTYYGSAEFQTLRNDQFTNWLGLGVYALSDKAGDGELSLTSFGLNTAYHLMLNESNVLSLGLGINTNTRAIDFNKLSYDMQWDGMHFNRSLPNGELRRNEQSRYINVLAGVNYMFFPNEFLFFKIGAGLSYVNMPKVTLIKDEDNRLGMRPTITGELIMEYENGWRINPSAYFTYLQSANMVSGGLTIAKKYSTATKDAAGNVFAGLYYRLNESIISTIGIEYNNIKLTAGYDFTVSSLKAANQSQGAFELSIVIQGFYKNSSIHGRTPWECPRF